jgi:hypothetical protein
MNWLNKLRRLNDNQTMRFVVKRTPLTSKRTVTPSTVVRRVGNQVAPKTIKYYLSDPTTPSLIKEVIPPTVPPNPAFKVVGYTGPGFTPGTVGAQAGNVYITIANGINNVNLYSPDAPMTRWAAISQLNIIPRAGQMMNAFYNRQSLAFFYDIDPVTNKTFFCADSADVVIHELGHAILDSYRPELWNMISLEVWAFHEAFADFMSVMNAIMYDESIDYLLNQTGGNLRTGNLCSNIAEEFGLVIWRMRQGNGRLSQNYLRCAYNGYKYTPPALLSTKGPDDVLTSAPHSFSRVMSGALYDCFVRIYEANINTHGPAGAIKVARDTMMRYVLKAIRYMPLSNKLYASFANTLLWADYTSPLRQYHNMMWEVFQDRQIISDIQSQSVVEQPSDPKLVRACDLCVSAQSGQNPLHEFYCQVPEEDGEELGAALHYLHNRGKVSQSEFTPFEVCDNKIMRSNFACGCGCRQPAKSSPEFMRRYKPQNNAGCGCQQNTNLVEPKKPEIKKGCFIRYKVVK